MIGELDLHKTFGIQLWRDPQTGSVQYRGPKEVLQNLFFEVNCRVEMIFASAGHQPWALRQRVRRGNTTYGECEMCGCRMVAHRAGHCHVCVAAMNKVRKLDADRHFVFLDTETTARNPQRCGIIEIALVITDTNGKLLDEYHSRVKFEPDRHRYMVEDTALAINGYDRNPELWDDAPPLERVLEEVAGRVRVHDVCIAWNAGFDMTVIAQNARLVCNTIWREDQRRFDAMRLAEPLKQRRILTSKKLEVVARHLGVAHAHAHSALSDTHACKDVFFLLTRDADNDARNNLPSPVRPGTTPTNSGTPGVDPELGQGSVHGQERQEAGTASGDQGSG